MEGSITKRSRPPGAQQPATNFGGDTRAPDWRLPRSTAGTRTPFWQLAITLRRRKWFVLTIAVVGGMLAGLVGLSRPVLYEATSQLIIDTPGSGTASGTATLSQDAANAIIDDHLVMLVSQAQLRRAIRALSAQGRMSTLAALRKEGEATSAVSIIATALGSWAAEIRHLLNPGQSPVHAVSGDADEAPLKALRNGLRVGQELRSRVISIGFTDRDPEMASLVVNTFVQAYVDQLTEQSRASSERDLAALNASIPEMQSELASATLERETYLLTKGAADQASADATAKEISQLKQLISVAETNLAAARKKALDSGDKSPLSDGSDQRPSTGQGNQAQAPLDQEIQIFEAQIASLKERDAALEAMAADAASRLSGLRALELQLDAAANRYNETLAKRETLRQHVIAPTPGIAILSAAWPPTDAKTMPAIFLVPPGMIFFGLLAAIAAVLQYSFDDTLRSDAESEELLGIRSAGMLPYLSHPTAKYLYGLLIDQPKSTYGRAVSSISVSLIASDLAGPKSQQLVLVTSSTPRDGKTELAWSLALSAHRLGRRALFIDLDAQEDPLTRSFRQEFGSGTTADNFADFFQGRAALDEAVESMPRIGVDFMRSPTDLAGSLAGFPAMDLRQSVDKLRKEYSLVIVNGPTGIEAPEVRFLAARADAVLFAIRWGQTKRKLARAAIELVMRGASNVTAVRSVLIGVNLKQQKGFEFEDSGDLMRIAS